MPLHYLAMGTGYLIGKATGYVIGKLVESDSDSDSGTQSNKPTVQPTVQEVDSYYDDGLTTSMALASLAVIQARRYRNKMVRYSGLWSSSKVNPL
jgi:hypothetical protein